MRPGRFALIQEWGRARGPPDHHARCARAGPALERFALTSFGRIFLAGTDGGPSEVLAALTRPMLSPGADEGAALFESLQPSCAEPSGRHSRCCWFASSATGLAEAAIRCAVEHRVLVVVGGFS